MEKTPYDSPKSDSSTPKGEGGAECPVCGTVKGPIRRNKFVLFILWLGYSVITFISFMLVGMVLAGFGVFGGMEETFSAGETYILVKLGISTILPILLIIMGLLPGSSKGT